MLCWSFLTSCNDSRKREENTDAATADTVQHQSPGNNPSATDTFTQALHQQLGDWMAFQKAANTGFDPAAFRCIDTTALQPLLLPFTLTDDFRQLYQPYLRYAPDSSRLLDWLSYKLVLRKDRAGNVRAMENPDSELSILLPAQHQKQRLLFSGPAASFDDAIWLDEERILVVGTADAEGNGRFTPISWLLNLNSRTIRHYAYEGKLDQSAEGFWKTRIKPLLTTGKQTEKSI
jgi:hypothetical protein